MVRGFRFDGGSLWLDFAATLGRAYSDNPQERLHKPADLDAWLREAGLHAPAATWEDLTLARDLRATFRCVSEALVADATPSPVSLSRLARWASPGAVAIEDAGARFTTIQGALGALTLSALMTANSPERHHLRQCQDADCAWVFLDPTGRRHWCSTRCGNRSRVRAHRARQQAT